MQEIFYVTDQYVRNGYANRREYLESLAEDYGAEIVFALASMLGQNEDFDGLVTSLEDYEDFNY